MPDNREGLDLALAMAGNLDALRSERARLATHVGEMASLRKEVSDREWARFFKEEQRDAEHSVKAINLVLDRVDGDSGPMAPVPDGMIAAVRHYAGLASL